MFQDQCLFFHLDIVLHVGIGQGLAEEAVDNAGVSDHPDDIVKVINPGVVALEEHAHVHGGVSV